jgi:hypothetical protein
MCTCATPPEDARLLAFLDGEPDPKLAADLTRCPSCRERLATLDAQQRSLMIQLRRTDTPSSLELGEYVLGMTSDARKREIESFLHESERGRADVAQLRAYLESLKGDVEYTPLERVQVLVAELVRGLGPAAGPAFAPALAGIRGGAVDDGTRLYRAGDVSIALDVMETGSSRTVLGLVSGAEPEGLEVELWQGDALAKVVPVDEVGNFSLENVARGQYTLALTAPELEIHVPGFSI